MFKCGGSDQHSLSCDHQKELLLSTLLLSEIIHVVSVGKKTSYNRTLEINPFIVSTFLNCVPEVEWRTSAVSATKAQQLQQQKQRLGATIDPLPIQPHSHHIINHRGPCLFPRRRLRDFICLRNGGIETSADTL